MNRALVGFLLTVVCASPSAVAALPDEVIAIKAARIIDGTGREPLHPGVILIEGGHIREVGSSVSIPADAHVIDLGNVTVLPVSSICTLIWPTERIFPGKICCSRPPQERLCCTALETHALP